MTAVGDFLLAIWFTQFQMMPFKDSNNVPVYGAPHDESPRISTNLHVATRSAHRHVPHAIACHSPQSSRAATCLNRFAGLELHVM